MGYEKETAGLIEDVIQRLNFMLDSGIRAIPPAGLGKEERTYTPLPGKLSAEIKSCRSCSLGSSCKSPVPGIGFMGAKVLFVGPPPGPEEEREQRPFAGSKGELITKIIGAMKLDERDVYICNILRCRPSEQDVEIKSAARVCIKHLERELDCIRPVAIVAFGGLAGGTLLETASGVEKLRGRFHTYRGVPLMVTYDPESMDKNKELKRPVWEDIQMVMALLEKSRT